MPKKRNPDEFKDAPLFEDSPGWTQIPNVYFDYWLPRLRSMSAIKVLEVIMRQTYGVQNRRQVLLTRDALETLTGMHREEVGRGLDAIGNWSETGCGIVWRRRATLADFSQGGLRPLGAKRVGFGFIYGLIVVHKEDTAGVDSRESRTVDSREFRTVDSREFRTIDSAEKPPVDTTAKPGPKRRPGNPKETTQTNNLKTSSSRAAVENAGPPAFWKCAQAEEMLLNVLRKEAPGAGFGPAICKFWLTGDFPARTLMHAFGLALQNKAIRRPGSLWKYLETVMKDLQEEKDGQVSFEARLYGWDAGLTLDGWRAACARDKAEKEAK
jgi:hypothetical protein